MALPSADEEVVGLARAGDGDLAHGDAGAGMDIQLGAVLHDPAGRRELAVDVDSREGFRIWHDNGLSFSCPQQSFGIGRL